jgi:hypothetical protein
VYIGLKVVFGSGMNCILNDGECPFFIVEGRAIIKASILVK